MQTTIDIRPMLKTDLAEVARVHSVAFKDFFLTLMGEAFLCHYYNSVMDYQKSIALVAVDENSRIVGLAVGFKDPRGFYRHFRRYRFRMLPTIAMGLLRRPWIVLMVLRNAARVSKDGAHESDGVVELSSICSIVRKQHVGTALLNAFLLRAQEMGAWEISLTTDEHGNSAVRTFYERHGFVEQGRVQRGQRLLVVYSRCINEPDSC